jgi:hypothetical protein
MGSLDSLRGLLTGLLLLPREVEDLKLLVGRLLLERRLAEGPYADLREAELSVFSQFGDDGIIQYLVSYLGPLPPVFVEFGVEDYRESNTRLLLLKDNWSGLVMDSSQRNLANVRRDRLYWQHDLQAVTAFVTRENIELLLSGAGISGEIGLLSIDIDGNDYWVWEAIESVRPVIVVVEYNSVLGPDRALTVPYEPNFERHRAHWSGLYYGASLAALAGLAERKGYALIGSNSAGNNAYFAAKDRLRAPLRALSAKEAHVRSVFRESRDRSGRVNHLRGGERLAAIASLPIWDTEAKAMTTVGGS